MKDDFIPGGECLGTYSSEKGFIPNPKYSEHIKNDTQKYQEKKTVSSVGFKTPLVKDSNKTQVDEEAEKLERLISLKNERIRLERQLENLNRVIKNLEND